MKANQTVFLVWRATEGKSARMTLMRIEDMPEVGKPDGCSATMGAMFVKWRRTPESELMECVLCTGFHIAENYGVPVKEVINELEKIEGFNEYWNSIGVKTGMR